MSDPSETLPDAQVSRNALLANLRHELRTPLNAIIGYSEMLLEDAAASPDALTPLKQMLAGGRALLDLVNTILDPTRIKGDDFELHAPNLCQKMREPVHALLKNTDALIGNAAKLGLADFVGDLEKVREAGRRLLAQTNGILTCSHPDRVAVPGEQSANLQASGMTDYVAFMRPSGRDVVRRPDVEGGRLLVVDDIEMNRDVLSRRLQREGHTVMTAASGAAALALAHQQPFDVILLDILMPEMSGLEVLNHLKADVELRHIPVIMISALDEMDSIIHSIETGAEDYLPKPFEPALLRARVGACLEKKRLRDREEEYRKQIEAERNRADTLLHVILPAQIVQELKATNEVKPRRFEDVAIMFCDIVGFTPYCDKRQPEEVVANLQEMIVAFEDYALEHKIQKIKTIGDAFMAACGLLEPVDNPVLNCVRCGIKMIEHARKLPACWEVRIGLHVGSVVAGVLGHRQYLFDLWGDTVNTAARMESHGVAGAVALSETAFQRVAHCCRCEARGVISVKGKGNLNMFVFREFIS